MSYADVVKRQGATQKKNSVDTEPRPAILHGIIETKKAELKKSFANIR